MQKWFDEGYFTPELPMRRTHLDTDWVPVGVLEQRANGGKIFLVQPPAANGPPGLSLRTESLQNYPSTYDQNAFNGYQPVPQRAIRSATLDASYLNNTSPSESPSSSLGGGRFGSGSPDASTFNARSGNGVYSGDPNFGGRALPARASFQDPTRLPFNNNAPGMTSLFDAYGNHNGWPVGPLNQGFNGGERHFFSNGYNGVNSSVIGSGVSVNQVGGFNQESLNDAACSGMGSLTTRHDSPLARQAVEVNGLTFNASAVNGLSGSQYVTPSQPQYPQASSASFPPAQQHQIMSPFGDVSAQASGPPHVPHTPTSAVQPHTSSPWPDPSPIRRTKTFDAPATSPAVPPAQTPHGSNWTRPSQPLQVATTVKDPSPWLTASLGGADDVWREVPGPNSLTFSNLGQHNKLHEQQEEDIGMSISPIEEEAPLPTSPEAPATEPAVGLIVIAQTADSLFTDTDQVTSKPRGKATARDVETPLVQKAAPPPLTQTIAKVPSPTSAAPAPTPKSVWSMDDESKKAKPPVTLGLREIQEAEAKAKKAEARKAAEKERIARANAVATASNPDDAQPFTTSWGLPTSQTGARNVTSKETPTSTPMTTTTSSGPVWTNTVAPSATKKTMKEIQEEEEKRKKGGVKESVASAASRRAYAETAFKVSLLSSPGAWVVNIMLLGCTKCTKFNWGCMDDGGREW